jgi:hypothetical protein
MQIDVHRAIYSTDGGSFYLGINPSDLHRLDIASAATKKLCMLNYKTRQKATSNGNLTTQVRLASISQGSCTPCKFLLDSRSMQDTMLFLG